MEKEKRVVVEMLKTYSNLNTGEMAEFPKHKADHLLHLGVAKIHHWIVEKEDNDICDANRPDTNNVIVTSIDTPPMNKMITKANKK